MATASITDHDDDNLQDQEHDETVDGDPYVSHFQKEISEDFASRFREMDHKITKFEWPKLGELIADHPSECDDPDKSLTRKTKLSDFCLKENLKRICKTSEIFKHPEKLTPLQSEIFSIISEYKDFQYAGKTHLNRDDVRVVYCLHVLNHVLKSRAKIKHHNSKLAKNPDEDYRDQGYTRPTVLILAPFKDSCLKIVNLFSTLLGNLDIQNKQRFLEEYSSDMQPPRKKPKPADFDATFAGNVSEDFRVGLRVVNSSVKLYVKFYAADIIIASPLGLRTIVGAEGDKDRDFDFLSSIEILILDEADTLMMQNWMHVAHLMSHMNLQPKEPHGCDFSRIRPCALEGWSKFYRQTLLFSSFEHPWHRAIFGVHCFNHQGYIRTWLDVKVPSICQVVYPMPQIFHRFESDDHVTDANKRFEYFTSKILPNYRKGYMAQTLVFIPSYFDFVRLRNYFRRNELSATMICEYTNSGKVAQGRNLFFNGHRDFMLYTERIHFYRRYEIKGVENILFYQLPSNPSFYHEICNFVLDSNPKRSSVAQHSSAVIFSQFDCQQLKHVVGVKRTQHMLSSSKDVFMIETK